MKIMPVSAKIVPAFTSRSRSGQDNVHKLHREQDCETNSSILAADKSLLRQKFDFNEEEYDGVDIEHRTYDSFTGLRDKNYLLASLYIKMRKARLNNKPLSIAMFDMDNFKSVNELLGYQTGDTFIKEISKEIAQIGKENNIDVYRFGGEEFILIFDKQTEAKKEEIVRKISYKANANPVVQSYRDVYIRNAQSRLDKSLYSTAKVRRISELKTKRETLEEVLENLTTKGAKNDPYFKDEINEISSEIKKIYIILISECLPKEHDYKATSILLTLQSKLTSDTKLTESEEEYLNEYLNSMYDKANEIYQTKKWISDFNQSGGFGITCGVVDFEPEPLEYKSPMDIIQEAGEVLKKGKETKKGQIYHENIKQ